MKLNDDLVRVGQIIKPQGIKGQVRVYNCSDFVNERFSKNKKLFLETHDSDELVELTISSVEIRLPLVMLSFKGYSSIEAIEPFSKCDLYASKSEVTLPDNNYFNADLIGCDIYDEEDTLLGKCINIFIVGPNSNLEVELPSKKVIQIPFIRDIFIKSVDIINKKIVIKVMEGLLE